ncbi:MAG: AsnC family transcriptional regulator [Pseudomonadota bacterium]
MNDSLDELDKRIIAAVQADIPVTERPYAEIARQLGISEETLLDKLNLFCRQGIIRRFGATLRHQKSGFSANAMVAWQINEAHIAKVGEKFSSFPQVSHCYRRNPTAQWPYNLYTMVHAHDQESCREIARQMASAVPVVDYAILFSRKELKKTSMAYFPTEDDDG